MAIEIGTSGGVRAVNQLVVGTIGGNKTVSEVWIGTTGGNKLAYSAMSVLAYQPYPAIPDLINPDGIPESGDEFPAGQTQAHCTVTGGVAPYSFSWQGAAPYLEWVPDNTQEDVGVRFLGPASVAVIVTDANGFEAVSNLVELS